jgi:23S rRNA pseudouridine2457 synthase
MIVALHKPYGVLSQFTPEPASTHRTLAEFGLPPEVYPVGRLDGDSEGLLLLTDDHSIVSLLLEPSREHPRTYWVQVEGAPTNEDLERLRKGVVINGRRTLPCTCTVLDPQPDLPQRVPPIRVRKHIPATWIELVLHEGRNRQVRKMTAHIGYPTLRLIRVAVGRLTLASLGLEPGQHRVLTEQQRAQALSA